MIATSQSKWRVEARHLSMRARIFPLLFFIAYLTGTVLLFAFGPWPWPVDHPGKLYTFLLAAHSALVLGYLSAAGSEPRPYRGVWRVDRMILLSVVVNLLLLFPTSIGRTGSLIPDVASGVSNPGGAYASAQEIHTQGVSVVEYLRLVTGPVLYLVFPLTVFFWSQLQRWLRRLAVTTMLGFAALYVAMGTNRALADYLMVGSWLVVAALVAGMIRVRMRSLIAMSIAAVGAFALFLVFFTIGQVGRPGMAALSGYFSGARIRYDPSNVLMRHLPLPAQVGLGALTVYTTQGYYALGLALDEPFEPTYGVGNSTFLTRNVARLSGNDALMTRPYPLRISYRGWDAFGYWSSIYPWLASDVTFPGTIILIFLIGRVFALTWIDSVGARNPLAVVVLAQFVTMLFYFPANNQLGQSGELLSTFVVTLTLWLIVRRRPRPAPSPA